MAMKPNIRNYVRVWIWLLALVVLSTIASFVLSKTLAVLLIFAAAFIKAGLVLLHYMHLKLERPLFYSFTLVPVILVLILILALFPDFVFHR